VKIKIFQIDAFTDHLFGGNPAAVCPLDKWLEDEILQCIAAENNLAETAYFVHLSENRYHLRWFTPEIEMDLCGHATLASAFVLINEIGIDFTEIIFESKSGELKVKQDGNLIELNFPSRPPVKSELPKIIQDSLNIQPKEIWKARDYLLLYESEEDVKNFNPNLTILNQINIDPGGIIVTAEGASNDVDFVSRFFTPQASVLEDPVTGSAHCTLLPFWADRINKQQFRALQISSRRGELFCNLDNDRVFIRGQAVKYLEGFIEV